MRRHIPTGSMLAVLAIALTWLLPTPSARAEVHVTGDPEAVRVDASDAPIEEVLAALGQSFGLQHRSSGPLTRRVTGTYEGSLPRIVRRLLDGYDFVMKSGSTNLEVVVIGVAPAEARPGMLPSLPPPAATGQVPIQPQMPTSPRRRRAY
jgi:hypothetical protein